MQYRTSYGTHRGMLNINKNKSPAFDRFRRQSEMVEDGSFSQKPQNFVERTHNSKERKISEDLTSKNFLSNNGGYHENQIFHFKSQKSFENSKSQSHSSQDLVGKKETSRMEDPHFKEEENRSFTKK